MPHTRKVPKPKVPHTPYFVTKYKNWETKSLPRSWKSASTTAANNPDWLEEREQLWEEQKRNYAKEVRIYQHKLAEYERAKFQELRNTVVAQAARVAKLKSADYLAEKAARTAEAAARASERAIATAEREAERALKEASKPPTARDLRMAERGTKNKTRKSRKYN